MNIASEYVVNPGLRGKSLNFISNFISIVLIPLLIPVYLFGIILYYFPFLVNNVSESEKLLFTGAVFVFTILLPFVLVYTLYKLKMIESLSLYRRKDRYIPQAFSCFSYILVSAYFSYRLGPASVLSLAMIANTISAVAITFITRWWKISTHAAGAIGFMSIVSMIYIKHPTKEFSMPFIIILCLCTGVCFARIYLKAHTVMQVLCGSALGIVIGASVFYFLK